MNIKKLDQISIQNICANQVILDIASSVKELLENSLDANSTIIEISLKNYGQEGIIVKDNGDGINSLNFDSIIKKGSTSKLTDFNDLNTTYTYGFRGEALNSLNQISNLTICTRTENEDHGWKLKFNKFSEIITKEEIACEKGTTISLEEIFENIPVRNLDLKNNYKQYYTKLVNCVTEYAIISLQCRISLYNEKKSKQKELILTNGNIQETLINRIRKVLGNKEADSLINFDCNINENFKISGYLLKNINSGSGSENLWLKKNILFFYVNKRPINVPKKFFNLLFEIYKQFNPNSKFIAILNFELKSEDIDYNLSPDKREIYFKNEQKIVEIFKNNLIEFHEKQKTIQKSIGSIDFKHQNIIPQRKSVANCNFINLKLNKDEEISKRFKSENNKERISHFNEEINNPTIPKYKISIFDSNSIKKETKIETEEILEIENKNKNNFIENNEIQEEKEEKPKNYKITFFNKNDNIKSNSNNETLNTETIYEKNKKNDLPEIIDESINEYIDCNFKKEMFLDLKIIGQFNLGFIISYLEQMNQIFIIDQHAADEKYNYETMMRDYKFESQLLFNPITLNNLTILEKSIVEENLSIFIKNGFNISINEQNGDKNYFIKTLPCFKNIQFDINDFLELLQNICQNDGNDSIRPNKLKNSIAYKACRKAIKVGDSLNIKSMSNYIKQLTNLKSPWNCPHGRPTMVKTQKLETIIDKISISKPKRIKF